MSKEFHEGTIGIPQKDGSSKIAHYWVKAYDEGSDYGINGGRISKLSIKIDGEWVVNYDRGWDIEPDENDEAAQIAYCILLNEYN
ncbi:MAG: hypothetical protein SO471_12390 [Anaerobutyricum hallii]|uniref:DUF7678 domain-containing protein n=1 Tax=Anaerobutyricum hallii TaxID=39488 RepID=UPI002A835625|nr:hypothetical protein [Anaerobutyricum hallii]MDY4578722.1 hypothetical protein [Anaerobutyricum hallii]